jgi:hypothetical protein
MIAAVLAARTFACRANRRQVPFSFLQMFVKRRSTVRPATRPALGASLSGFTV